MYPIEDETDFEKVRKAVDSFEVIRQIKEITKPEYNKENSEISNFRNFWNSDSFQKTKMKIEREDLIQAKG